MADELALRRQCLADFRALVAQYPTLGTTAAHARLTDYVCQQTVSEGNYMPAKDYRTLGEDLVNVAVRLPQSVIDQVDLHIITLRTMSPWARVGRSEALRDLILRGLHSLDPQAPPAPVSLIHAVSPAPPVLHDQPPLPLATETAAPTLVQQPPEDTHETAVQATDTPAVEDTPLARRRNLLLAAIPWEHVTPSGVSPADLRQGTGLSKAEVENDLRALHKRGDVVKIDKGRYVRRLQR